MITNRQNHYYLVFAPGARRAAGCSSSEHETAESHSEVSKDAAVTEETTEATEEIPSSENPADEASDPDAIDDDDGPAAEEVADGEVVGAESSVSARGNLVKNIGELAGLTDENAVAIVSFKVTEIDTAFKMRLIHCRHESDRFVGLKFEFETAANLRAKLGSDVWITDADFATWDPSGKRVYDPLGNAIWCASQSQSLPSTIGPGELAEGWIVLDLPKNDATVGYYTQFNES